MSNPRHAAQVHPVGMKLCAVIATTIAFTATAVLAAPPRPESRAAKPEASRNRFVPLVVDAQKLPTLRATLGQASSAVIEETNFGGNVAGIVCGPTTHAADVFGGGTVIIQAGFAEAETAWAEFTVDPSLFPIRIESVEFVFGQQGATETTTTEWSLHIWDGPPALNVGLPLFRFESIGSVLPSVVLGPGTQAVNVRIDVDPADPVQLIVNNDTGSNSFSVGYRIERHNNPPASICDPPDQFTNAFPVTDGDGIFSLSGNWLSSLDCLFSFCAPGTLSFADRVLCRPSGDWLIRVTFSCTNIGACCDVDGLCVDDVSETDCSTQRGTFMGPDSLCANVTCPEPAGACCFSGQCLEAIIAPLCASLTNTVYMGNGTLCTEVDCTLGACCMPDGSCADQVDVACLAAGGVFEGASTDCATFSCPQPRGACCIQGFCFPNQAADVCESSTGVWQGAAVSCNPDPCAAPICPTATILDAVPPTGTVDARQPHAPDSSLPRQGIGSDVEPIILELGASGAESCFTLCETAPDPMLGSNAIVGVVEIATGVYGIVLDHGLSPGAVTTIRYEGDGSFVSYTAHPANANGDQLVDASDIQFVIDAATNTGIPTFSLYAADIDRSGQVTPTDMLRLIDMLHGGDSYDVWLGSALPTNTTCP